MTTPTTTPGTRQERDGRVLVEFTRTFHAPIHDVWTAVTEPERLARWIGSWHGDPASGEVQFRMLHEGNEMPEERFEINQCDAPHLLRITSTAPSDGGTQVWRLSLDLTEDAGTTTLVFSQDVPTPELAEGVGPGWHYYLDRLVAAETGHDPASIEWDDYYPGLAEHYKAVFS